jgi:hypothetical protein
VEFIHRLWVVKCFLSKLMAKVITCGYIFVIVFIFLLKFCTSEMTQNEDKSCLCRTPMNIAFVFAGSFADFSICFESFLCMIS